ncbi:hypothetical protein ACGFI9_32205 [Micromonospora sp. NPDC048930]|uniref:hypothetical protein n=1 Tax=Micromonospora sp. NPDC048930 TaxID=3364261 RepID=UPI00371D64B4
MAPIRRVALTAALATTAVVLATPATAFADGPSGADFGQHVRTCAQTMGFTGQHNPGMHSGYAGWDGMTCVM